MGRPSRCSLHQEEFKFEEHPRKPTIRNACFGSNSETRGSFCDGLGNGIVVKYSVGFITTLHGRITAREYVDRLCNQVHTIRFYFITTIQFSKMITVPPFTQLELFNHVLYSMNVNFNIFPGQHNHKI
jgi:hypothetical protein